MPDEDEVEEKNLCELKNGTNIVFFNLAEKKFRFENLRAILNLSNDDNLSEEILVLTNNLTLEAFSSILDNFNLNPILLQEVASV